MAVRLRRARAVRLSLAAAAVAGIAVVSVTAASASTTSTTSAASAAHPAAGSASQQAANKQAQANLRLVEYFNNQLFNDYNLSVIDRYVGPQYTQHNPTVPNGPDGLRNLVIKLHGLFPNSKFTVERAVAEGDLVFLESNVVSVPGTKGSANFDIYRVEGGKLVEHWDVLQTEPATTASGNDMLSQLSSPSSDYAPPSVTTSDEGLVLNYLTELAQDHDLSAISRYVSPSLYQHDPTLADGSTALKQAYSSLFAQDPNYGIQIAQVVAEGDLVAVHAHVRNSPSDLGQAVVYLFRVRDGKIVEQWDSVQDVPATSANDNTMF